MSKYLVIIEAPGKVKKIKSFLGSGYDVLATKGHIRDLPDKKLGVNIKNDFEPEYVTYSDKKSLIKDIKAKAKKVDVVYLLTDGDREGEGISFHVANILPQGVNYKRGRAFSITKTEIQKAINNAGDINYDLVNAYECRRILDRLVGYKCSYIVKTATGGPSAGRTQSAGLYILAEREKEIQAFVPVIYWPVEAELLTEAKEKIVALIKKPKPLSISTKKQAEEIVERLKKGPINVSKYEVKDTKTNSYPPFKTSTLQQAASTYLGFSPDRTMKAAQALYQAGFTTYHRTDSLHMISDFVNDVRSYLSNNYKKDYLPDKANVFATKSKNAQEAHEAIRPTDVSVDYCSSVGADASKIYKMIWKRAVSSQMTSAIYERRLVEFSCDKYILAANGSKELFDGFKKVWDYSSSTDSYIPDLKVGDEVWAIDFKVERKQTQPPSRYSEASFIKELEKRGIGRPSTYASIPKTLLSRSYIETKGKSKTIHVTDLGLKVTEFLVKSNFCFIDLNFTADMEEKCDLISNGNLDKIEALQEFWTRLKSDINNAKQVKKEINTTDISCPKCKDGNLVKKHSKWGDFYGCSRYKEGCKFIAKIGENGEPIEKKKKKIEYSDYKCPKCKSKMIKRTSKHGEFYGCSSYPSCKGMRDKDGNEIIKKGKKK